MWCIALLLYLAPVFSHHLSVAVPHGQEVLPAILLFLFLSIHFFHQLLQVYSVNMCKLLPMGRKKKVRRIKAFNK